MQSANCLYFRQMGMYVPVPSYYDQAQVIKISVNHVLKLLYDQANKRKIIAIYHQVCGVATLYALLDSEVVRLHRNRCVRVFVQCVHAFCFNFSSTHNFIIIQRVEFVWKLFTKYLVVENMKYAQITLFFSVFFDE